MTTSGTTPSINDELARRAEAARKRARRGELTPNALTVAEVLALPEPELARLVAVDHFGWDLTERACCVFDMPKDQLRPGAASASRGFNPCYYANDDRLALAFVRRRHRPLLGSLAEAMLDLARARSAGDAGAPLDPLYLVVVAKKGDYCRALLLIASNAWRADRAQRPSPARATTEREAHPPLTGEHAGKEAHRGLDAKPDHPEHDATVNPEPQEDHHHGDLGETPPATTNTADPATAGPADSEPAAAGGVA